MGLKEKREKQARRNERGVDLKRKRGQIRERKEEGGRCSERQGELWKGGKRVRKRRRRLRRKRREVGGEELIKGRFGSEGVAEREREWKERGGERQMKRIKKERGLKKHLLFIRVRASYYHMKRPSYIYQFTLKCQEIVFYGGIFKVNYYYLVILYKLAHAKQHFKIKYEQMYMSFCTE